MSQARGMESMKAKDEEKDEDREKENEAEEQNGTEEDKKKTDGSMCIYKETGSERDTYIYILWSY